MRASAKGAFNMKRKLLLAGLFAAIMALALCACGQQGGSGSASGAASDASNAASSAAASREAADASGEMDAATQEAADKLLESATTNLKTVGDLLNLESPDFFSSYNENQYVCAFGYEDGLLRAVADLPDGMYEKLEEVFLSDDDKARELLEPLEVTDIQVIAPSSPTQEEVDALFVGKTGAEMNELGVEFNNLVVNGEETDCNTSKYPFDYLITFDGAVPDEDTDDPNGALADLTIKAASVQGICWEALEG